MSVKHTEAEPRLLISRTALLHNARILRREVGDHVRICAILKADAYGHGAPIVADTLCNFARDAASTSPPVDAIAVATIEEAFALPEVTVPVIVFRPLENLFVGRERAKIELAIREGFVLTICSATAAEDLARIAIGCGRRASVQVIVDTGMTRAGVGPLELEELLRKISAWPSLRLTGLCTHFANAENGSDPFTHEQFATFRLATDQFAQSMQGKILRHAANSAATFFYPESHLDMIRPGLALYGIDPTLRPSLERPLRPVMKWTAPLVGIRDIAQNTAVGYGQTWRAARNTRIGLVPVGYADGYFRSLSNKASVIVGGKPAPVVGRVSMDLITIDLGGHRNVVMGQQVTLLDNDPLSPASVYRLSELADTIPYEIFCRIGSRVRRVVLEPEETDSQAADGQVLNAGF